MQLLSDEASYRTYFENISNSHVELNWDVFGDAEAVKQKGTRNMKGLGIWIDEQEPVGIEGAQFDNFLNVHQSSVVVMITRKDKAEEQKTDYNNCQAIVKDIISKMIADRQQGTISCDFNRFKYGEVLFDFDGNKYTACRLDLQWQEAADLRINPAKWQ